MNKKMSKRQKDMKSKLMAAICMLLVSSIMMVSTTYAWFTLSTAPEVTGITTAVGANGNLEMALLPTDGLTKNADVDFGITTGTSDSMAVQDNIKANVTWGNLVNLTTNYGLENITLYPAALNSTQDGYVSTPEGSYLKIPSYGADGRVAELKANTFTGTYNSAAAVVNKNDEAGVRVIGVSSGMTDQQIAFRNARSTASSAASQAGMKAKNSLSDNGDDLASIVIKYARNKDSATFNQTEVGTLRTLVSDLDEPLDDIEESIRYFAYAWEISQNETNYTEKFDTVLGTTENEYKTALSNLASSLTGTPPDILSTLITNLNATRTKVSTAQNKLDDLTSDSVTWPQLNEALSQLVNIDNVTINGQEMSAEQNDIINAIIDDSFKATLTLKEDSGVYADIANYAGDYSAVINVDASGISNGMLNREISVTIATKGKTPSYLKQASEKIAEYAPTGTGTGSTSISEAYGYIIDLAFKTNAANSSLLLQSEAIDRIYNGDNSANSSESTMGNGSTMHFESQSQNFSDAQMTALMQNIRVIFFEPSSGQIVCYAMLDTSKNLATGTGLTYQLVVAEKQDDGSLRAKTETTEEGGTATQDNTIMELTPNTATRLSVLVYLDGEKVTNKDVVFDSKASMKGSLNLQFASSANLVPMVYSDFKEGSTSDTDDAEVLSNVTVTSSSEGTTYTATAAYSASKKTVVAQIKSTDGKVVSAVSGEGAAVKLGETSGTYNSTAQAWVFSNVESKPENATITISGTVTTAASTTTKTTT